MRYLHANHSRPRVAKREAQNAWMEPLAPFYAQMTSYQDIAALCQKEGLEVLSGLHPEGTEHVPEGTLTLLLLGPDEPHFGRSFKRRQNGDGQADPMDRWSTRVITQIAQRLGGQALFPLVALRFCPFTHGHSGQGVSLNLPFNFWFMTTAVYLFRFAVHSPCPINWTCQIPLAPLALTVQSPV